MKNVLVSLAIAALVFCGLALPGLLTWGEAAVPAVLGLMIAYFVLARRSFKKVETIMLEAAKSLQSMPPKMDHAIRTMEKAYPIAGEQFGIRAQIDNQIGVVHFLQKDFAKAQPFLSRSLQWGHWMGGAMLGVIHYKKKNHDEMRKTFAVVLKKAKGQSLAWNLYAYLLSQIGATDEAIGVLSEGLKKTKSDQKIQESLLAIQNGRKIKMRGYKEQWYQFHLDRPPVEQRQVAMGGKVGKVARRGRW